MNYVLFEYFGLPGKTDRYKQVIDDDSQYFLHNLLDKKIGGPLSYAVLYYILAQQVGLECEVLAFPSHYYIKVKDSQMEFYVNPFERGKITNSAEFQRKFQSALQRNRLLHANLYEKVNPKQLIARLVQQLKHVYVLKSIPLKALRAVEVLTAMFPDSPELARDRGILYCEMEYFSKAAKDLRFYLRRRPKADDVREIRKLASMLKGYRETMN
jgi:regulator of sirC expression with transglutaminase-like and TPR domain